LSVITKGFFAWKNDPHHAADSSKYVSILLIQTPKGNKKFPACEVSQLSRLHNNLTHLLHLTSGLHFRRRDFYGRLQELLILFLPRAMNNSWLASRKQSLKKIGMACRLR
jgi:hypothetical protein